MVTLKEFADANYQSAIKNKHWVKNKYNIFAKFPKIQGLSNAKESYVAMIFNHQAPLGDIQGSITFGNNEGFDYTLNLASNNNVAYRWNNHASCTLSVNEKQDIVKHLILESTKYLLNYKKGNGGAPKGYKGLMLLAEVIGRSGDNVKFHNDLNNAVTNGVISKPFKDFLYHEFKKGFRTKFFR